MARTVRQAAVLAIRSGRICMITSRNRKRWVIPKGVIEKGQSPEEAALAEAWEEAGLRGRIDGEQLGKYPYVKNGLDHIVTVFILLDVTEQDDWPEAKERRREWLTVEEAVERIDEIGLRELVYRQWEAAQPSRVAEPDPV